MPLIQMAQPVAIDAILYARDQVIVIEPPGSGDVVDGAHGSVVSSASVWCEHANRLETEFGGDPPWTGCAAA